MTKPIRYAVLCSLSALLAACGGDQAGQPQTLVMGSSSSMSGQQAVAVSAYYNVVQHIYVGYFGRPADAGGLEFFATRFRDLGAPTSIAEMSQAYAANADIRALIDVFGTSDESKALYAGDNAAFLEAVYRNLFGRPADAAGKAFWARQIDEGNVTRASAAVQIMAGSLDSDAVIINRKTAVAANFTTALNTSRRTLAYDGLDANVVVRNMLGNVTASTDPFAFQASVNSTLDNLVAQLGPQGMYSGKLTGNSSLFHSLVLEDGQYWGFYSNAASGTFNPVGFVQGQGAGAAGKFTSQDIRDFGPLPAVQGNISADYVGLSSFNGVIGMPNPTINFTTAVLEDASYRYLTPASVADIAGTHNVGGTLGFHAITIKADGSFSGTSTGGKACNYAGTLAPRATRRNVFNVSWTFAAGTCPLSGQTGAGVAYSYLTADGAKRHFVIAAVNPGRSAGTLVASASGQVPPVAPPTTLQVTDTVSGTGATAATGQTLTVHYTGWLYSTTAADHRGAKFDSSLDRGTPFVFQLGGQVIAGWNQGMVGMKVGGKRTLVIPPNLGYGAFPNGSIPANSTLVFEVELLGVK